MPQEDHFICCSSVDFNSRKTKAQVIFFGGMRFKHFQAHFDAALRRDAIPRVQTCRKANELPNLPISVWGFVLGVETRLFSSGAENLTNYSILFLKGFLVLYTRCLAFNSHIDNCCVRGDFFRRRRCLTRAPSLSLSVSVRSQVRYMGGLFSLAH